MTQANPSPATPATDPFAARLALVFLGGTAGALLRYLLLLATPQPAGLQVLTVFAINVAGSYLLGLLTGRVRRLPAPTATRWRLLLGTGALGGFTTYSTFALQLHDLLGDGAWRLFGSFAALSVVLGVGAAVLGLRTGSRLADSAPPHPRVRAKDPNARRRGPAS